MGVALQHGVWGRIQRLNKRGVLPCDTDKLGRTTTASSSNGDFVIERGKQQLGSDHFQGQNSLLVVVVMVGVLLRLQEKTVRF